MHLEGVASLYLQSLTVLCAGEDKAGSGILCPWRERVKVVGAAEILGKGYCPSQLQSCLGVLRWN